MGLGILVDLHIAVFVYAPYMQLVGISHSNVVIDSVVGYLLGKGSPLVMVAALYVHRKQYKDNTD